MSENLGSLRYTARLYKFSLSIIQHTHKAEANVYHNIQTNMNIIKILFSVSNVTAQQEIKHHGKKYQGLKLVFS